MEVTHSCLHIYRSMLESLERGETVLIRVVMLPYTPVPTTKINYKHINMILTYVHIYTFNMSGL